MIKTSLDKVPFDGIAVLAVLHHDDRVFVSKVLEKAREDVGFDEFRVGITRQVGALFVIGDIDTAPPDTGSKENNQVLEGDDGEAELIKSKVFQHFLQYFRENKRVVAVDGDEMPMFFL
ncbi:hypothetical protein CEP54_005786 [Fusarium duplospermum]|uniref:Uncharacterized protein n=1 Tax=Fusarium duplospermum TaxID=1325734 RepID=A0A428QAN5_9HYPO|nr:hypothetical protein CEP54_005786 [Fusarium duplospermum]